MREEDENNKRHWNNGHYVCACVVYFELSELWSMERKRGELKKNICRFLVALGRKLIKWVKIDLFFRFRLGF